VARSADPARTGVQWLDVPHAAAVERLFVLAPLADLAPGLVPPGWPATVATLRDRQAAVEGPEAIRSIGTWQGPEAGWA
jgi:7,8-dihydro-6-hydroxymethylpterin-pyrophosphokinase